MRCGRGLTWTSCLLKQRTSFPPLWTTAQKFRTVAMLPTLIHTHTCTHTRQCHQDKQPALSHQNSHSWNITQRCDCYWLHFPPCVKVCSTHSVLPLCKQCTIPCPPLALVSSATNHNSLLLLPMTAPLTPAGLIKLLLMRPMHHWVFCWARSVLLYDKAPRPWHQAPLLPQLWLIMFVPGVCSRSAQWRHPFWHGHHDCWTH